MDQDTIVLLSSQLFLIHLNSSLIKITRGSVPKNSLVVSSNAG